MAKETGIVEDLIDIALAVVGRFSGGAGYVALLVASGMGALSASAPGNAASVGSITIPLMKRSGFSPELAASAQASFRSLGPVIPPSGTIVTACGLVVAIHPDCITFSEFWVLMWGIALIFIFQRIITLWCFIKKENIGPVPKEKRLPLKAALKKGWTSLLMPVIILVPFVLDAQFSDSIIAARLGTAGAKTFSSSLLVLVPSITSLYAVWVSKHRMPDFSAKKIFGLFKEEINSSAPVVVLVFAGFLLGEVYDDIGVGAAFSDLLLGADLGILFVAFILPLLYTILGMFLEPMATMLMIGPTTILLGESVGINPILMASMLPMLCQGTANQTPPFASALFVSMGIADSDFMGTSKRAFVWVGVQYVFMVLVLLGIIPVLGLKPF